MFAVTPAQYFLGNKLR